MDLDKKVVLVTGSAERVGKAILLEMARNGAQTVVHYRSKPKLAQLAAEEIAAVGPKPLLVQGDISKQGDWQVMIDAILNAFGRIDVLVNNAAIFYRTPFLEATEDQWDHFMDVNLKGTFWGCRLIGELMFKQESGKIVNIADVAAENVWPSYIPYCVSKAGVIAMTKGLARALAPHVTVNAVAPGTVLLADSYDAAEEQRLIDKTPLRRVGTPEDIASAVMFVVQGSDFVNGALIKIDGGRSLV